MSLIVNAKLLAGELIFNYQNRRGYYRLSACRKMLAVLVYHGLETDPRRLAASGHRITPEGCLKEIRFFQQQGYRLVSAEEIEKTGFGREDDGAGYLLVSFDDGHANIFPYLKRWTEVERVPVLLGICPGIVEENGIYWWEEVRARFALMQQPSVQIKGLDGTVLAFAQHEGEQFADCGRAASHQELQHRLEQLRQQTRYIDRQQLRNSVYVHENMNWHQIIELSRNPLCSLASHSMYHEIATQVSLEELRNRTQTSQELIESRTGRPVRHYVYPNGSFSDETDQLLADLGIVHTYTTECALNLIPFGMRLNRLNGYDLENRSLRHYGERWKTWHVISDNIIDSGVVSNSPVNAITN